VTSAAFTGLGNFVDDLPRVSLADSLCQLSEKKPRLLDELAAERKQLLEKESAELQQPADKPGFYFLEAEVIGDEGEKFLLDIKRPGGHFSLG
jgi:hypothetical protein